MDIRPNRPAAAAESKTTTQTQKSQSDSSLLSRMAVRTMLEDLETLEEKPGSATSAAKLTAPQPATIIPVPLPPAFLASPIKNTGVSPSSPTPSSAIKTEPAKKVTLESLISSKKLAPDELARTSEEIGGERKKGLTMKSEVEAILNERDAKKRAEEEEKKKKDEEKLSHLLAEKSARELKLAREADKREANEKIQEEINKNVEQVRSAYQSGDYDSAIELAQKVLEDNAASWFLKLKINWLVNKANRRLRQEQKRIEQLEAAARAKIVSPTLTPDQKPVAPLPSKSPDPTPSPISIPKIAAPANLSPSAPPPVPTQKIMASPPPNLPTLPDTSGKDEAPSAPPPPRAAEISSLPKNPPMSPRNISPLLTELISENSTEPAEELSFGLLRNKRVLFIGASLALVIILVGFGWWLTSSNPPAVVSPSGTPTASASPTPSRPAPNPLFSIDKQQIITLKNEGASLRENLLAFAGTDEPAGTFTALIVKNETGQELPLSEIIQNLNLGVFSTPTQDCGQGEEDCLGSKTLEDLLDLTNFSLFVYSQNSSSTDSFSPFTVASSTNDGRLGLIISLKKQALATSTQTAEDQLMKSLRDLEAFLPKDFASFLLKNPVFPEIPTFLLNPYKNVNIRYLNFPSSDISLDYTVLDNRLIFATSKESMLTIVDRLLAGKQPNQTEENF